MKCVTLMHIGLPDNMGQKQTLKCKMADSDILKNQTGTISRQRVDRFFRNLAW